jgi:hypothetical protein
MSGASNFLSRWSRLKREAEEKRPPADAPSDASGSEVPRAIEDQQALLPELTPEELAALPRLEDLTPDADLTPFMRAGIPATLRNAALRRMWALDPGIRDRVGDALEYAYDWNIPGGVPGTGPLLASDNVQEMLRAIVGAPEAEKKAAERLVSPTAVEQTSAEAPRLTSGSDPEPTAELAPQVPRAPAKHDTAGAAPAEPASEIAQTRRHGGATPF